MDFNAKRKKVIFSGLIIALVTAMYVNWYYTRPETAEKINSQTEQTTQQPALGDAQYVNGTIKNDYFSEAELKRSQLQDKAKQNYIKIIESKDADEESKQLARESLEQLNKNIMLQGDIETLIKTKTGKNVFVTLSDTVEVIMEKGSLNNDVVLQIEDIVTKKADIPSEKITIIESK